MSDAAEQQRNNPGTPLTILYNPRQAAGAAAGAGLWFPLLLLAAAGAAADYPTLWRIGPTHLVDAWTQQTPEGLPALAVLCFLVSQYLAPVLLPLAALAAGWLLSNHLGLVLDVRLSEGSPFHPERRKSQGHAAVSVKRAAFRLTAWAFLPLAAERFLVSLLRWLRLNVEANPFNPLASNLGFFLDPTNVPPFWYRLASGLDVFSIWTIALAALALAGFSKKPAILIWPILAFAWLLALVLKAFTLS
jgi:hypothetical protein